MFRKSAKKFLSLGAMSLVLGGFSFAQTFSGSDEENLFQLPTECFEFEPELTTVPALSTDVAVENLFAAQDQQPSVDSANVLRLYNLLNEKTVQARASKNYGQSLASRIKEIETLKQELANLLHNGSSNNNEQMMNQEIQERLSRPARAAEKNADGTLNARGQARLANDLNAIREKYNSMGPSMNPDVLRRSNLLKSQIASKIRSLESAYVLESSIQNSGLELFFEDFKVIGGEEGWPYTVVYTIEGNEIFRNTGVLSYKDISGRGIPNVPSFDSPNYADDLKKYENFLDNVEVFNKAFANDVDFVEALVTFQVRQGSTPSSYNIAVGNVSFKNIVTGGLVKTFAGNRSGIYQSQPQIDVDLTMASVPDIENVSTQVSNSNVTIQQEESSNNALNIAVKVEVNSNQTQDQVHANPNPQPVEEKKEPAQNVVEEPKKNEQDKQKKYPKNSWWNSNPSPSVSDGAKIAGKKNSLGSILYFLPGTLNTYANETDVGVTVGYSLNFGFTEHLFAGLNLETGFFTGTTNYGDYYNDCYDADGSLVFTGVFGGNWSVGSWLRMNVYTEAGLLFDDFAAGLGASIEFSSPKSSTAFNIGMTDFVTASGKNIFKSYIGLEILF